MTTPKRPLIEVFVEGEQWKVEAALRDAGFAFVVCPTEFGSLAELEAIRDDNVAKEPPPVIPTEPRTSKHEWPDWVTSPRIDPSGEYYVYPNEGKDCAWCGGMHFGSVRCRVLSALERAGAYARAAAPRNEICEHTFVTNYGNTRRTCSKCGLFEEMTQYGFAAAPRDTEQNKGK